MPFFCNNYELAASARVARRRNGGFQYQIYYFLVSNFQISVTLKKLNIEMPIRSQDTLVTEHLYWNHLADIAYGICLWSYHQPSCQCFSVNGKTR